MSRVVLCVQNLGVPDDPRVWREARALAADGHAVTVVAPAGAGEARCEHLDGVDVVRYRSITAHGVAGQLAEVAVGFVRTATAVLRLHRRAPIDVLHVANPPDTLFPLAWWLRRSGTAFVYDQHDAAPELATAKLGRHPLLERVLRMLERASYRSADLVITANDVGRRRVIASGVPATQVVTVRLGPDASSPPSDPPERPTVAFAGAMGTQDGVEVLVDAVAALDRRRPGAVDLLLIGGGDAEASLRRRIADHHLAGVVTWTGWLPRSQVHDRLRTATVAVSPDVDDPYTRLCTMVKVGEYLAAGVPTVVADLPENRVTAGDAARYVRPGDSAALADALDGILFDPVARRELADAAARRAPALLWAHSAPRLVAAYRHLLDGGAAVTGDQHLDQHLDPHRPSIAS